MKKFMIEHNSQYKKMICVVVEENRRKAIAEFKKIFPKNKITNVSELKQEKGMLLNVPIS